MKKYVKPSIDIVDLKVKENIAALPQGLTPETDESYSYGGNTMTLTTYNLAAVTTSQTVNPNTVQ